MRTKRATTANGLKHRAKPETLSLGNNPNFVLLVSR